MCTGKFAAALLAAAGALLAQAPEPANRLSGVKRLCVGKIMGDAETAPVVQEVAIGGLYASQKFAVTENCEKADAILKGAVMLKSTLKARSEAEESVLGGVVGAVKATTAGVSGGVAGYGVGGSEALSSAEKGWQATVSLRLVDREGEILWAGSWDSPGGKSKSPVPDATERLVRQLVRELERESKTAGK
jgi:hypothetical protein